MIGLNPWCECLMLEFIAHIPAITSLQNSFLFVIFFGTNERLCSHQVFFLQTVFLCQRYFCSVGEGASLRFVLRSGRCRMGFTRGRRSGQLDWSPPWGEVVHDLKLNKARTALHFTRWLKLGTGVHGSKCLCWQESGLKLYWVPIRLVAVLWSIPSRNGE